MAASHPGTDLFIGVDTVVVACATTLTFSVKDVKDV